MSEFKENIKLTPYSEWVVSGAKAKADDEGYIECPFCFGSGVVEVEVELPSGNWTDIEDECQDCEDGHIHIDELDERNLREVISTVDYRMDCAESVRLLSSATRTDFFLNLCKAKEMHL